MIFPRLYFLGEDRPRKTKIVDFGNETPKAPCKGHGLLLSSCAVSTLEK